MQKVSALEGDQDPAMTWLMTVLMVITALIMLCMLLMVLVEKCCGIKPSMAVKKCKKMCKSKRVVDHSQVEGDHDVSTKYAPAAKPPSNRVVPTEGGEEVARSSEEASLTEEITDLLAEAERALVQPAVDDTTGSNH